MDVQNTKETENTLTLEVGSNEETLFSLLKVYLQEFPEVDIVGVAKDHHLVDKTEFYLKVKEGNPKEIFKKGLKKAKEELEKMRET